MSVVQLRAIKNEPDIIVKADTENGFLMEAHEITLALCKVDLNKREGKLFNAIKHKTYGYKKAVDWITNTQLSELTGIGANHISEVKKGLLARKILIEDGRKIGINPIVSEWQNEENYPKTGKAKITRKRVDDYPIQGKVYPIQGKKLPDIGSHKRKDNITKDNTTKDKVNFVGIDQLPEWLSKNLWIEFIQMRKSIKKPVTENIAKRMIAKLIKFKQAGHDPIAALTRTIDNCWADIFEPKLQTNINSTARTIAKSQHNFATLLPGMTEDDL